MYSIFTIMNSGYSNFGRIFFNSLHQNLTLDEIDTIWVGDLETAKEMALKLKTDDEFYKSCSETSLEMFEKFYTEKVWKENWNTQW